MSLLDSLLSRETALSVTGLGYVGLPLATAFARHLRVIGYDRSGEKIALYRAGRDPTREVGDDAVRASDIFFTSDEADLREARFHIVAVPTPVNPDHTPDLSPVRSACRSLGRNLTRGSIVVFESTVYPGVTEEICVPILEECSGLRCGDDFSVGYSPERINPGDKQHRLDSIVKIVSGIDEETRETVASVYSLVCAAGVYRAPSVKVAEAAKVIENSQRDINIAFMNELSIIFDKMGIDTREVLDAAGTKWNFLPFTPGLVGGHCIGVDPYYLTYKAETLGYHSEVILAGRHINDEMGRYVAQSVVKMLVRADVPVKDARVAILGFTFKENCPDTRNTKVFDILQELREYGIEPILADPLAGDEEASRLYGVRFTPLEQIRAANAVILAVPHERYARLTPRDIAALYEGAAPSAAKKVLFDVKGILDKSKYEGEGYLYRRL